MIPHLINKFYARIPMTYKMIDALGMTSKIWNQEVNENMPEKDLSLSKVSLGTELRQKEEGSNIMHITHQYTVQDIKGIQKKLIIKP